VIGASYTSTKMQTRTSLSIIQSTTYRTHSTRVYTSQYITAETNKKHVCLHANATVIIALLTLTDVRTVYENVSNFTITCELYPDRAAKYYKTYSEYSDFNVLYSAM